MNGDSLWSIASKYNTTVDELKRLNNLSTNNLSVGQLLKLPSKSTSDDNLFDNTITYTVKKGDSLWSIASKYNTTVDELKRLNNLSTNNLSVGQLLKIPSQSGASKDDKTITYVVKKGDSLWLIANKYDTTVDEIKKANNLTSNLLSVGQVLIIPSTSNYVTYVVKNGDSLWKIANKFGVTIDSIRKINNLSSDLLSAGQKLLIKV